jgi:cobalt-zinc-cadmium efflux system membrane fusion protein
MKKLIVIFSLAMLVACGKNETVTQHSEQPEADSQIYKFASVAYTNLEDELILNGEVSFDEDSVVRIFPLVSGKVETVHTQLGAFVQKGQTLAVIKSADITGYIKDYEVDKANVELAKKSFQNTEALYKSGFSSETDYLTAKKELEKANQELARSSEVIKIYGGATQADKPYFVVKAPIAGYIVEKKVNAGQDLRADNSDPLFMISNLRKVWVLASVYEKDIAEIKNGQEVQIQTLSYPDKIFTGTISNISSVLDKDSRVLKVRVEIDNKDGLLKPDMFATIHLHLAKPDKMLAVPQKAVVFDNDSYYVVVEKKGKYEKKQIQILKSTSGKVFIKGDIQEGEKVVTEGSILLFNELNG